MRIRTREENFWAKIAQDPAADKDMKPLTTEEYMMDQAAKVIEEGGGLPEVTSDDNGDVLAVVAGEWSKAPAPLPSVTADDNGDVLAVVDGAWSKAPAPSSLPPYTSADKGKGLFLVDDAEHPVSTTILTASVAFTEGRGEISDFSSLSALSEGDTATLTINDVNYTGAVESTADGLGIMDEESGIGITWNLVPPDTGCIAFYFDNVQQTGYTGTFTVTVRSFVPSVKAGWENSSSMYLFEAGETTPNDVYAALEAGKIVVDLTINKTSGGNSSAVYLFNLLHNVNDSYTAGFMRYDSDNDKFALSTINASSATNPFMTN